MLLCPAIEIRDQTTSAGTDAMAQVQNFAKLGFDHVYIIDRYAQHQAAPFNTALVHSLMSENKVTAWIGGGIRDAETVRAIVKAGAERVVLGPSFWRQQGLLETVCREFPDKIVALVDALGGYVVDDGAGHKERVLDQALRFERAGVAGIIYMEHEREGAQGGLDAEVIADLAFALTVPLYVTGGINAMSDLRALKAEAYTGIAGVILGRALLDGRIDPITALALLKTQQTELS